MSRAEEARAAHLQGDSAVRRVQAAAGVRRHVRRARRRARHEARRDRDGHHRGGACGQGKVRVARR